MKRSLVISALFVSLVAVACRKTAAQERVQDRATAEAEANAREVSTTTITSAEMESAPSGADSGASAFLAEQDDYRVRLRDAIDASEHLRHRGGHRDLLRHDL